MPVLQPDKDVKALDVSELMRRVRRCDLEVKGRFFRKRDVCSGETWFA